MTARYDGFADWYESFNRPHAEANKAELMQLLGPGDGSCLDLGCGTGLYFDAIRATGRTVVGLDRLVDQLRYAAPHGTWVQADAQSLPFRDGVFPTIVSLWASTDVDDFAAVVREAARVLRPGGLMVFWGAHPCFNGPHVQDRQDGARIVYPTYRVPGWHTDSPWWGAGLRHRVGMSQVPLPELFNAFIDAGLAISHVVEPRVDEPVPFGLALRAFRPGRLSDRP